MGPYIVSKEMIENNACKQFLIGNPALATAGNKSQTTLKLPCVQYLYRQDDEIKVSDYKKNADLIYPN